MAKTVQRFIDVSPRLRKPSPACTCTHEYNYYQDCKTKPMEEEVDARWRIGPSRISIDDLELVGLQHVSMGSWQAHLRLRLRA